MLKIFGLILVSITGAWLIAKIVCKLARGFVALYGGIVCASRNLDTWNDLPEDQKMKEVLNITDELREKHLIYRIMWAIGTMDRKK